MASALLADRPTAIVINSANSRLSWGLYRAPPHHFQPAWSGEHDASKARMTQFPEFPPGAFAHWPEKNGFEQLVLTSASFRKGKTVLDPTQLQKQTFINAQAVQPERRRSGRGVQADDQSADPSVPSVSSSGAESARSPAPPISCDMHFDDYCHVARDKGQQACYACSIPSPPVGCATCRKNCDINAGGSCTDGCQVILAFNSSSAGTC